MKIVVAILIFGIIVLIHEFGHFILAKLNGITVVDFSIGMGPRLCGFRAFGTQFSVRLLPIGGACMMLGEDLSLEETVEDSKSAGAPGHAERSEKVVIKTEPDEHSFFAKGVWQRIAVLFAGPGFNFILAFVLSLFVIGIGSFLFAVAGHLLGIRFGKTIARRLKPELFGGLVLLAIGVKILVTHLME